MRILDFSTDNKAIFARIIVAEAAFPGAGEPATTLWHSAFTGELATSGCRIFDCFTGGVCLFAGHLTA